MSLDVTMEEGLFVVKVTSDPESYWPPLCQIIWNMCRNSDKSSVQGGLKLNCQVRQRSKALGAVQMLLGITDLFLAASHRYSFAASTTSWLGFVFLASGLVSILAVEKPRRCLVLLSVVINLVAAALALVGIGLCITDLPHIVQIVLIILAVLQIMINVRTSVFAMEVLSHNSNNENEDEEPLLKEYLISSAEKKLHQIPSLTK